MLSSKQAYELFDVQSGIGDDAAQGSSANLLVVRDDGAGARIVPAQDHMAAGLATEHESGAFQRGADFTAGKISGEFGHAGVPSRV